jgi:hypothetical protein
MYMDVDTILVLFCRCGTMRMRGRGRWGSGSLGASSTSAYRAKGWTEAMDEMMLVLDQRESHREMLGLC